MPLKWLVIDKRRSQEVLDDALIRAQEAALASASQAEGYCTQQAPRLVGNGWDQLRDGSSPEQFGNLIRGKAPNVVPGLGQDL